MMIAPPRIAFSAIDSSGVFVVTTLRAPGFFACHANTARLSSSKHSGGAS